MRLFLAVCIAGSVLSLAACNPGNRAASGQTAPASTQASTPPTGSSTIWLDPAAVSSCGAGQIVTVHWNARGLPNVRTVEVRPLKDGKEGMFAKAGATGSKVTGAWMHPGVVIILRNGADESELGRATAGSVPCTK